MQYIKIQENLQNGLFALRQCYQKLFLNKKKVSVKNSEICRKFKNKRFLGYSDSNPFGSSPKDLGLDKPYLMTHSDQK